MSMDASQTESTAAGLLGLGALMVIAALTWLAVLVFGAQVGAITGLGLSGVALCIAGFVLANGNPG
jgi:hypothetical protein